MASMICRVTISMPTGRTAATNRQKRLAATTPGAASQTMRNMGGTFRRELNRSCQSFFGIQTVSALIIFFTVAVVIIRVPNGYYLRVGPEHVDCHLCVDLSGFKICSFAGLAW